MKGKYLKNGCLSFYQQHWQSAAFQVAEIQTKNLQTPQTNLRTKQQIQQNKDTASDEASDVQDGDTPDRIMDRS